MPTYIVTLNLEVSGLDGKSEAQDFAVSLAEHIQGTFNDNETISRYVGIHTKLKGKK